MLLDDSTETDKVVNTPVASRELIARNVVHPSQYSGKHLKKNRFYPNLKKESRDYPGRHICRLSVHRLCHAGMEGAIRWTEKYMRSGSELIGYEVSTANVALECGFILEPAAHRENPYHAHIYIKELDLPFPADQNLIDGLMSSGLRRRLDNMRDRFEFIDIKNRKIENEQEELSHCHPCLIK